MRPREYYSSLKALPEAARISRIKGRDNRRAALKAIPDPERRDRIRAHVEAIFRRRRC